MGLALLAQALRDHEVALLGRDPEASETPELSSELHDAVSSAEHRCCPRTPPALLRGGRWSSLLGLHPEVVELLVVPDQESRHRGDQLLGALDPLARLGVVRVPRRSFLGLFVGHDVAEALHSSDSTLVHIDFGRMGFDLDDGQRVFADVLDMSPDLLPEVGVYVRGSTRTCRSLVPREHDPRAVSVVCPWRWPQEPKPHK